MSLDTDGYIDGCDVILDQKKLSSSKKLSLVFVKETIAVFI